MVKDLRDYCVSFSKIKKTLNFDTSVSLEVGIEEILESFKRGEYSDFEDRKFNNYLSLVRNR